jgi:uncharacterized repeat protein (TIGR03843 family)
VQLFVDEDPQTDVRDLVRTHPGDLRRLAVLDVVINNADRKAGHLIVDRTGKLWGVDHGVTFNAEHKLRTVVWTFEGEPIPEALLDDLQTFEAGGEFEGLLDPDEREALGRRVAALTSSGRFPAPGPGRSVPWPPW